VGVPFVVCVVGAVLQVVRLLFSGVGSGWATGAGVNDGLAHLSPAVAQRRAVCFVRNARSVSIALGQATLPEYPQTALLACLGKTSPV
jgi:hypothetical protein